MPDFRRFAIYDPGPAPLAGLGAAWLGWDAVTGRDVPALAPASWVEAPRRYGFHATIKAPFRLAQGCRADDLATALHHLAGTLRPVDLPGGLHLAERDGYLALIPRHPPAALGELEARVVTELDRFRAPLTEAEIARRNPDRLDPAERSHLTRWGYPYVLDRFRYHMTLTGPLEDADLAQARDALSARLAGMLPDPHPIRALALMGEDETGRFHEITRARLGG